MLSNKMLMLLFGLVMNNVINVMKKILFDGYAMELTVGIHCTYYVCTAFIVIDQLTG